MFRLFTLDTDLLSEGDLYRKTYDRLSLYRKEKADRYRFQKDKSLCVGAGILVDAGLSALGLSFCERTLRWETAENGKPFFPDLPGLFFNISHTGHFAAAVFSDSPAGVDVEVTGKADLTLSRRFFTEGEHAFIQAGETEEEQRDRFFRIWTLKESFMKCTGLGMKLPLSSFEIDCRERRITVRQNVDDREYSFREFTSVPGCKLAVCSAGSLPEDLYAETVIPG